MNEVKRVEEIGRAVLDAAFKVHSVLGPGLLESVYEAALAFELRKRGCRVEQQAPIPVFYEGEKLEVGFRADLLVDQVVLVEIKSVEAVTPLFKKITTNYLKLIPLRLGFLINFNIEHLKDGITRVVNGQEGKFFFQRNPVVSREGGEDCEGVNSFPQRPSLPSRLSRDTP